MELLAFFVLFLICMGIAKVVNSIRRTLTVNGASIYLVLAIAFIIFNFVMASRSDLGAFQVGHAFGYSVAPAILVGLVAIYYFFKFRTDKAHELHVKKLRDQRVRDGA